MYAKLEDGVIRYALKTIKWHNCYVSNPSKDKLLELGYLPVVYSEIPDDAPEGKHYEYQWTQTELSITQNWILVQDPDTDDSEQDFTLEDLAQAVERGLTK